MEEWQNPKTIALWIAVALFLVLGLTFVAQEKHLDRDCFELFLRERVYLRYAKTFLAAEQIDEVIESRYLAA